MPGVVQDDVMAVVLGRGRDQHDPGSVNYYINSGELRFGLVK
jgi:hypothetical protein